MIKIFIVTHKDYDPVIELDHNVYTLISNKPVKNNSNLPHIVCNTELEDKIWSELACLFYIQKEIIPTLNPDDYIGIEHYRRHFNLDFNNLYFDIMVPEVISQSQNNKRLYGEYHNIDDIKHLDNIIFNYFGNYYSSWQSMLYSNFFFPYNIMLCRAPLYNDYLNFLFSSLFAMMNEKIGINKSTISEIDFFTRYVEERKENYILGKDGQNSKVSYQIRIPGFLSERLTTTWIFEMMKQGALIRIW